MKTLDLNSLKEVTISAELVAESVDRKDYDVQLKYASRLASLSNGLSISHSLAPNITSDALKVLDSKLRLISRTNELITEEVTIIQDDPEYAQACVSWLPAKVYYNIYHLLAIIEFILTGEQQHLRISHQSCLKGFANRLSSGTLKFNCSVLNNVSDKAILDFQSAPGEVLSQGITDQRLVYLIMKKIATDTLKDLKLRKCLNLKKKADRTKYQKAKNELTISIMDFFYSMRIRTNYRDISFLDDLDANRTQRYFLTYNQAYTNFYSCLHEFKDDLIAKIHLTEHAKPKTVPAPTFSVQQ